MKKLITKSTDGVVLKKKKNLKTAMETFSTSPESDDELPDVATDGKDEEETGSGKRIRALHVFSMASREETHSRAI